MRKRISGPAPSASPPLPLGNSGYEASQGFVVRAGSQALADTMQGGL